MNEHGYFKLASSQNVIFLWVKGPGNQETFDRYNAEFNALIEKEGYKNYAVLVMLGGENIMTPEVFASFQNILSARIDNGVKTIALFITDSNGTSITQQQVSKLYQATPDFNVQFFYSFDEAKQWLESFGFVVEHQAWQAFVKTLPLHL
ncbi:hypothetical protein [Thalassomonas actiniarum]|uniref:Uncharacterized protein n=1 Tax=Thalassomonas actiniarum TaxID=485447 RepID=A0AAE9YYE7_9GAMM|nr:hypothetical protein [Thalassomonas actiniarum]WDE02644.1 hypothetical protein SG35_030030 [Thalassomonas actiniarum]